MLKIENTEVVGWEAAIRGMRNPMNSWEKSDTVYGTYYGELNGHPCFDTDGFALGFNDLDLMTRLRNAGTDHRKFMRMITVYLDITAPLYWWKEFDTYKVGTVANSCSTMHKLTAKSFDLNDFSHEHLTTRAMENLLVTISFLNECRDLYVNYETSNNGGFSKPAKGEVWWQMIQLLPSSYNQKRTIMLNYEVLANMYRSRKNHKLDEWNEFCAWIETLPYAKELIIGE